MKSRNHREVGPRQLGEKFSPTITPSRVVVSILFRFLSYSVSEAIDHEIRDISGTASNVLSILACNQELGGSEGSSGDAKRRTVATEVPGFCVPLYIGNLTASKGLTDRFRLLGNRSQGQPSCAQKRNRKQ